MPTRTLEVLLTADKRRLTGALHGLDKDAKRAESGLDRMGKSGSRSLSALKTAAVGAGAALVAGLVVGTKKSVDAAIESEKANARLQAQLKALGISYSDHEAQIRRVIDRHSQLSGLDDEDLGDSFTAIVRVVGDVNKALKLNEIAMDLARARHMDVAKAGELVGKVAGGNTGILSRYGIVLKDNATASEAVALLQRKFAGQAEAYGKTTAGAADRSDVAFENLGETIGAKVTPIIARVAEGFTNLVRQMTLGEGPGGRIRAVFEGIAGVGGSAISTVRGLAEGFQRGDTAARGLAGGLTALAAGFVAFKVVTTAVAAVQALRAAWVGLTAAIAANPIGAVALGVTAAAAALGVMNLRTRSVATASRDLSDALKQQADALRDIRDIDIDVAQRKANVRSATVGVEQAERRLKELRHDGNATALDIKQAEADLQQARISHTRAVRDLGDAETDEKNKRKAVADATENARDKLKNLIAAKQNDLDKTEDSIRAMQRQGARFGRTGKDADEFRAKAAGLRKEIERLKSKSIDVLVRLDFNAAVNASPGGDAAQGEGWGDDLKARVTAGVKANASKLFFSSIGGLGGAFAGMTGLMGARKELAPFAAIGSKFGLGVSSGLRPGSITSSGNRSWHASGEAIDVSGNTGGMLAYAKAMANMFGGRLAELIHTPLGFSIKNGQRVAPFAQADHYDHVHVAMDVGKPGQGDGTGRAPRTGDGVGQAAQAAKAAGFRGQALINAVAIAGAESRYRNSAQNLVPPDHSIGMWQINQLAHHGRYGSDAALMNPVTNAKAAWEVSGHGRNFGPWSTWPTAAAAYIGRARAAVAGLSGGGSRAVGGGGSGAAGVRVGINRPGQGSIGTPATGLGPNREAGGFFTGAPGYELGTAIAQRGQARAQARDDLSGLIKEYVAERALKRRRLKRIRKVLRGRISAKRRIRLVNEETQLIGEIGDLTALIKEYKADQAGGATTISRAEELDAGVDTSAEEGGGGETGGVDEAAAAAQAERDRLAEELRNLIAEQVANQRRLIQLTTQQGPQIFAAFAAALDGQIGGPVGLGFQTVGYAGKVAAY